MFNTKIYKNRMENPTKNVVTTCTTKPYSLKAKTQINFGIALASYFVIRILLSLLFNI